MVIWTSHAEKQLRAIHDYIAQDSPLYAKRTADALLRSTIGLEDTPHRGRQVPEIKDNNLRELSVSSYRILYEVKSDRIEILAVIHKRRQLTRELL